MRLRLFISCAFSVLFIQNSFAQITRGDRDFYGLGNYASNTYSINDGLPSKGTTCTIKDKNGFLWVGSLNGLSRFDGYQFKTFTNISGDSTSLTSNYITVLKEDQKGRIWVGTQDGLNLFDPITEKFKRFKHDDEFLGSLSNNKIWSLLVDKSNTLWIGTDDGFDKYREKSQSFEVFKPNPNDVNSIKGKSVNAIIEEGNRYLWLGNWNGGLNRFDKVSKRFENFLQPQIKGDKNPNDIWSLSPAADGNIWIGTYWKGLFKFDIRTHQFISYESPDRGRFSVFRILDLGNGLLAVAFNDNFYWFNSFTRRWRQINNLNSFEHAGLFRDDKGILWIGSMEGLVKIDKHQFKFRFLPFKSEKRWVKTVLFKDNAVWLGTNNGLISVDLDNNILHTYLHSDEQNSIGSNAVNKLYLDSKNKLWALTEYGFDEFDKPSGKFIRHSHHSDLRDFFNEDVFRDITEVKSGEYWLATDAGLKIYHQKTGKFTHYFNQKDDPYSLSNNHLYHLLNDDKGNLWISTEGSGLNRYDPSTGKFYKYLANGKTAGISDDNVHQIFMDSHQNIWICTQDGLNKYIRRTDSFQVFSKSQGFASNVFKEMVEDKKGMLWIITENGVSRFNPSTGEVSNFDEGDGILANSAISKTNTGQLLLAGNKGIVVFDPDSINYNRTVPPVFLSDLQIFNKSVAPGKNSALLVPIQSAKQIILNYNQSVFSIEYVALNFTNTGKNKFAYKLDGFDKDWNYVGTQRKATYTNLDPGTYTFKVRAANNDGIWNENGKSIMIIIKAPWYLTWWAYMSYSAVIVGIVYSYLLYRSSRQKLNYEVKITKIEAEKEKELHERKLSYFTHVSHEFRTPLTLIINPLQEVIKNGGHDIDHQNLNVINKNARRLLSLVDQLLMFRKSEASSDELKLATINLVDLSHEVFLCFKNQSITNNIQYNFICPETVLAIDADQEKIEIVLFNLLSNAFKFTPPGGTIKMYLSKHDDSLQIEIRDSGCGISSSAGDKLYDKYYQVYQEGISSKGGLGIGLYLVKSYTEQHGGQVNYVSNPGEGTVFRIELPVKQRHYAPENLNVNKPQRSSLYEELRNNPAAEIINDELNDLSPVDPGITSDFKSILIVEDNREISEYLKKVFVPDYLVYEANNGLAGLEMAKDLMPDLIISDIMMPGMNGIELCTNIKEDQDLCHIPIILLTAIASSEIKLKGIEGGADDYISKPFEKEILVARVKGLLKTRNNLQQYFFNEVTLRPNSLKISPEYKAFLEKCISIVEKHLSNQDFNIKVLAAEAGMSHSNVYRKIKSISGQTANAFIRFIRLRKAAELFLTTDSTVSEAAYKVGFQDPKHFREQFNKLFGLNPSDYIKKFRKSFHNGTTVNAKVLKKTKSSCV